MRMFSKDPHRTVNEHKDIGKSHILAIRHKSYLLMYLKLSENREKAILLYI